LALLGIGLFVGQIANLPYGAQAQTNGYTLTWNTIDNGGATVSGGSYTLNSTLGQFDASGQIGNLSYTVQGGFWVVVNTGGGNVYLPLVVR
jgi:hypothetical protein